MTTRSKIQNRKTDDVYVEVFTGADEATVTSMESSVDLFVTFDEDLSQADARLDGDKLLDLSAQTEEEKQRNYYKVLLESAVDGVLIIDAEAMRIVLANRAAAELYGYDSEEDMYGTNPLLLVHPDDRDRVLRILAQDIIGRNLRLIHKFRALKRDGTEVRVRLAGSRTDYQGKLAGFIALRDITVQLDEVEDRNRAEERLEFIARLASIGQVAAGVSRELSDPISGILAYVQLLMARRSLDDTLRSGLEAISRQAERASAVLDNLVLFARRHKPEKSAVDVNQTLRQALDSCEHEMEVDEIQVTQVLDPALPTVVADPDQIRQVFVNILHSSSRAMLEEHGQGNLHIRSQRRNGSVVVVFEDDGPAIPEDEISTLFDPFCASAATARRSGLGLTVSYGLVEAHGGRIIARSEIEAGTAIEVEIPVVGSDTEESEEFQTELPGL